VNQRNRDIDTLFRRMATTASAPPAPAIEDDAAHAVDDWPLLAMLTHARIVPAVPARGAAEIPVDEAMPLANPTVSAAAPEPVPEPASRQLSPLEQLFVRAEQTGKPQNSQPSVFAPAPTPVLATTPTFPAPPPLKAPQQQPQRRLAPVPPAAPRVAAGTTEGPVTIEPQPRQWRQVDAVPEHLFERVGGR
jgi:hypothetical protein